MASPKLPPSDYLANENSATGFIGVSAVMILLATISVIGRFISRAMSGPGTSFHPRFWWDDWLLLLSLCMHWPIWAFFVKMYHLGLGHHIWCIKSGDLKQILGYLFTIYFLYDVGLALAKASALLFYSRVFVARVNKPLLYTIYAIHVMNIAWLVGLCIANFMQCNPVAKNWDRTIPGYCTPVSNLWLGSAITSVFVDLAILILPLPVVWKLSLSKGKKYGLTLVFLLGYCTIVVSIGRMVLSVKLRKDLDDGDFTYASVPVFYWFAAEIPATLISVSLPAMLKLGQRIASKFAPFQKFWSTHVTSRLESKNFSKSATSTRTPSWEEQCGSRWPSRPNFDYNQKTYTVSVSRDMTRSSDKTSRSWARHDSESTIATELPAPDGIHMYTEVSVVVVDDKNKPV